MKKVFLLLAASLFGMAAIAGPLGVTYSTEGDIVSMSVPFNQYGAGDEWQGGEDAGGKVLKDAVLEAGGSTSWLPAIGEAFSINMAGTTNFTGVIKLGLIDESADLGYWQDWGSFGGSEINVTAGEEFSAEVILDITKNTASNPDKPEYIGEPLTQAHLVVLCKMPGQDNTTFTDDAVIDYTTFEIEYLPAVDYEEPYMVLSSKGQDEKSGQYKYQSDAAAEGIAAAKAGQYVNVTFSGKAAQDLDTIMYTLLDGSQAASWWLPLSKDMALFAVKVKKGQEINAAFSWKLDTDPTEEPVFKNVFLANAEGKYAKAVFEAYSLTVTVTDDATNPVAGPDGTYKIIGTGVEEVSNVVFENGVFYSSSIVIYNVAGQVVATASDSFAISSLKAGIYVAKTAEGTMTFQK